MQLTSLVSLSQLKVARAKAHRHDVIVIHDEIVNEHRIQVYVEGGRGSKKNFVSLEYNGKKMAWDFAVEKDITNKVEFTRKIEFIIQDMLDSFIWHDLNRN